MPEVVASLPSGVAALMGVPAFAIALTILSVGASGSAVQARYFASPTGSGTECSSRAPCSLSGARSKVRLANQKMTGDILVELLGGRYVLTSTFALSESSTVGDSGTNGHDVIYEAAPGTAPVLDGGSIIKGWSLYDVQRNIWRAPVGSLDTRTVYVNGVRAAPAGRALPGTVILTSTGLHTSDTSPQGWSGVPDIELIWTGRHDGAHDWAQPRCRLERITANGSGSDLIVVRPCFERARAVAGAKTSGSSHTLGVPSLVQNSYTFLAQDPRPGSFYLDRRTGTARQLFYVPRKGENLSTATVVAARLQTLVRLSGTRTRPLTHVVLRGLRFQHAGWLGPNGSGGFPHTISTNYRSNGREEGHIPGSVDIRWSAAIRIEGSTFEHLGGSGLVASTGTSMLTVRGNLFRDISGAGVLAGTLAPEMIGHNHGLFITDNIVTNVGTEYAGSPGIDLELASDSQITNNQVSLTPYTGIISVGDYDADNHFTANDLIARNHVFEVMRVLMDGGGIYSSGIQGPSLRRGLRILNNHVHDMPNAINAIYTDGGSTFTTIHANVLYRNGNAVDGRSVGGCNDPVIRNEIITNNFWNPKTVAFDCGGTAKNVTVSGNTLLRAASPLADCASKPPCAAIVAAARPRIVKSTP